MKLVVNVEHKCVAGDASIFDHATGTYERARSLFARRVAPMVSALDAEGRVVVAQASKLAIASTRPIVRIETLGGRTLRVSENHPVWTPEGWREASTLDEGDWVATPRHMPSALPDAPLSDEDVRLVGYMIGDGSISNMSFTKRDEHVLADVVRCARALDEEAGVRRSADRVPHIRFSKVGPVAALMRKAGMDDSTLAADKRLPFHMALSDRQLGQLVGALWSTDGCIDTRVTTSGSPKLRVIYTSVSRALCVDIQHALQRLGLVANVRTTSVVYQGERRPVSTVQIVSRASKRRFLELATKGVIPLSRAYVDLGSAERAIPTSRQGDDNRMQPTLDGHVWWDRVESVALDDAEPTYDLEVPGPHTFVVDGIVTHNTTSLEIGPGSPYWRRLILDAQVSVYKAGVRSFGFEPVATLYDVVRKVAVRPQLATPVEERKYTQPKDRACKECKKKNPAPGPHVEDVDGAPVACVDGRIVTDPGGRLYANLRDRDETPDEYRARVRADIAENPEKYFQRGIVVRLAQEELDAQADAWELGKQIRESQLENRWPRNPEACDAFGQFCSYWAVCTGEATIDDPTRFRDADKHEELAPEDDGKKRLPLLTVSSMKSYRSCQRKYFYAYELRRRSIADGDALRFGTVLHVGLETWWKTVDIVQAIAAMRAAYAKHEIAPIDAIRAEELMLGYHVKWKDEPFTVVAVEAQFRTPLVNPKTGAASKTFQLGGKIDAVVEAPAHAPAAADSAA